MVILLVAVVVVQDVWKFPNVTILCVSVSGTLREIIFEIVQCLFSLELVIRMQEFLFLFFLLQEYVLDLLGCILLLTSN